jgi:hypothetical protein
VGKRQPRVECPKCGLNVIEYKLPRHIDDGWCISRQNLKTCRANGYDLPSAYNVGVNTVKMLAKLAGIELDREPVVCLDYGRSSNSRIGKKTKDGRPVDQRYMINHAYVAPIWLLKVAQAWRSRGNKGKFPLKLLRQLPLAVNSERRQNALIAELTLTNPERKR